MLFTKKFSNLHQNCANLYCYKQCRLLQQNPVTGVSCLFVVSITCYNTRMMSHSVLPVMNYTLVEIPSQTNSSMKGKGTVWGKRTGTHCPQPRGRCPGDASEELSDGNELCQQELEQVSGKHHLIHTTIISYKIAHHRLAILLD